MALVAFPYPYNTATLGNFAEGVIDWENYVAYFITAGPVLNSFSVTTRVQVAIDNLYSTQPAITVGQQMCGKDGRIYFACSDGNIRGYNPVTRSVDRSPFNFGGIGSVGYLSCFESGGHQYCCCTAQNSGVIGAFVFAADMSAIPPVQAGTTFNVDEHDTSGVPGNARTCRGNGYAVVAAISGTPASTIGYYKVTPTGHSKIVALTATVFDGSAQFGAFSIPGFDFNDGNIIHCVSTALGSYIFKLNSNTGAVMWKTMINSVVDLKECKITASRLEFVEPGGSPYTYYHINLATGAITTTQMETVLNNFDGAVYYSDKLSWLIHNNTSTSVPIGQGQWATFGPPPYGPITQGGVIRRG
jgi:hypothetical protein